MVDGKQMLKGPLCHATMEDRKATHEKRYRHWNKEAAFTTHVETINSLDPHHSPGTRNLP